MRRRSSEPALCKPVLLGITKASLARRVRSSRPLRSRRRPACLPRLRCSGKVDTLTGLKENVIVGRLIPAGTGLSFHNERRRLRLDEFEGAHAAPVGTEAERAEQALKDALNTVEG
jgi:DNA-directed RNA polymerase subunit beta'